MYTYPTLSQFLSFAPLSKGLLLLHSLLLFLIFVTFKITIFRQDATSALAGFHAGPLSWSGIGIWRCWLLRRQENRRTRRKTLGATREPTTNSTHIWQRAGIEPGPHWWEASALTCCLRTRKRQKKS